MQRPWFASAFRRAALAMAVSCASVAVALETVEVEGQPLAANVRRVGEALKFLGAPLSGELAPKLEAATEARDAAVLQTLLDPQVLLVVDINPELRVKVTQGLAPARLQQAGYT